MLEINQIKEVAAQMAVNYSIKKVSLFGSYAEGIASDISDVDLLVEFLTPNVSLLTLAGIKNEMEEKLHKSVDIIHGPLPEDSLLKLKKVINIYEQ